MECEWGQAACRARAHGCHLSPYFKPYMNHANAKEKAPVYTGAISKFLALMNEPERETNDDHDEDVADQRPNHAGSGSRIASAR